MIEKNLILQLAIKYCFFLVEEKFTTLLSEILQIYNISQVISYNLFTVAQGNFIAKSAEMLRINLILDSYFETWTNVIWIKCEDFDLAKLGIGFIPPPPSKKRNSEKIFHIQQNNKRARSGPADS